MSEARSGVAAEMLAEMSQEARARCTCDPQPEEILSVLDHSTACDYYKDRAHTWFDDPSPEEVPG